MERDHFVNLGTDGRKILHWIVRIQGVMVWTAFKNRI